jgi:hypothetical protein
MTNNTLDRTTLGFGISASVMSILNTLLVIFKELTPPFKKAMAAATGHHWTTHGVIVLGLFLALGFALTHSVRPESWSAGRLGSVILWSAIIGSGTLVAFYLLH